MQSDAAPGASRKIVRAGLLSMASKQPGGIRISGLAARLSNDTARRRALLRGMEARANAVEDLLRVEFKCNSGGRAILFHESIADVMALYLRLQRAGFRAIAEHSKLPDSLREEGLELFRSGVAQVIVSAKSLIEGFNVPAVDVGIIVASSGSIRQRIQSLGRVLRKHRGPRGEEKTSCMHILYARDTVAEMIYAKTDWERATGVDQNLFYLWDLESLPWNSPPTAQPRPSDEEVDVAALKPGDEYPGEYEGREYSCDTMGNIRSENGAYARNPGELPGHILKIKGSAGRFRITPSKGHVLVRVQRQEEWVTFYVATLETPLDFRVDTTDAGAVPPESMDAWVADAQPGDAYPFEAIPVTEEEYRFKAKRKGVICRRGRDREDFARTTERAEDPEKGRDAEGLIHAVSMLRNKGIGLSRLLVNEQGHVLYREKGKLFFIFALKAGLEFKE